MSVFEVCPVGTLQRLAQAEPVQSRADAGRRRAPANCASTIPAADLCWPALPSQR